MNEGILITFMASFLLWIMFAGLILWWLIDGRIKKEQALHALFSALIVWLLVELIKNFIPTLRPYMINGEGIKTITLPVDSSFPSAHTAVAFALAVSIFLHNKKTGLVFIVAALMVAAGRILANVHYPQDILIGGLLGILVSLVVDRKHFFRLVRNYRK